MEFFIKNYNETAGKPAEFTKKPIISPMPQLQFRRVLRFGEQI